MTWGELYAATLNDTSIDSVEKSILLDKLIQIKAAYGESEPPADLLVDFYNALTAQNLELVKQSRAKYSAYLDSLMDKAIGETKKPDYGKFLLFGVLIILLLR